MKKILSLIISFALLTFVASPTFAVTPNWDITGTWSIPFTCTYNCPTGPWLHQMEVSLNQSTGALSGNGGYIDGGITYLNTWNITSGAVSGDGIDFYAHYLTNAPDCIMHVTGTITSETTMSGNWTDNCGGDRGGTWTATGKALDLDLDNDGVLNNVDKCPDTNVDTDKWDESWGTNRWQVQKDFGWYQNKPLKKDFNGGPTRLYGIDYTYGCNGHQILDMLAKLGESMKGHWKFGLSSSVLDEFHKDMNDGVLDGKYLIETVTVPASNPSATSSDYSLQNGINYFLKARGTATACWQTGCKITFDAEYSTSDGTNPWLTWTDGVAAPYTSYGTDLLDLKVNGNFVNWGAYNPLHTYELPFMGTGSKINFGVYDISGSYFNDVGNLYVDIYAQL